MGRRLQKAASPVDGASHRRESAPSVVDTFRTGAAPAVGSAFAVARPSTYPSVHIGSASRAGAAQGAAQGPHGPTPGEVEHG
jgi:hypothetical protein